MHDVELDSTLPAGLPQDWRLDRDVPCPKCRYNLRMMREPRCPECGAVHRWQELLEISCPRCAHALTGVDDAACPRCRLKLNWAALLDDSSIHSRNFEFDSDPLRSAVRTGFRSLFPRRMWRHIALESKPHMPRLSRLRRFSLVIGTVAAMMPIILSYPCLGLNVFNFGTVYYSFRYVVSDTAILLALILAPVAITALLLPRFTPTLATFQIRREQLFRIFAYGRLAWIWSGGLLLVAYMACLVSIINVMLGEDENQISNEMGLSAIGEIANMITGNAATKLAELGYICDISPPVVIEPVGTKFTTVGGPQMLVSFASSLGNLSVRISLFERYD